MAEVDERDRLRAEEILRARKALEERSEWLRIALSSIGDAVIATDVEGRVTFMNGVAVALTGWPAEEAQGRALSEVFVIVHEITRAPVESPVARALREGTVVGLANHTVLLSRDGRETPIDDSAAPMRSGDGPPQGAVLVFRDVAERRRGEVERARLAEHLQLALSAADLGTWEWERATDRVTLSPRAAEIYGVAPGVHVRTELQARIGAGQREAAQAASDQAVSEHADYDVEYAFERPHKPPVWVAARGRGELDAAGTLTRMLGVVQDTTARKEAETSRERLHGEAEAERKKLAEIFRLAPSFMAVLRGPSHVFERFNDRYSELVSGRDLLGKSIREAFPELVGQGFYEILDRVYETGEPYVASDARVMLQRADGTLAEAILEFVYQPLRDAGGSVSGVIVQGIDRTERQRSESALTRMTAEAERRKRLYETVMSSTPDLIYVFGLDHRFTYANESLLAMWGRTWEDSIGKTCLELGYEPWHAAMHDREIDQVVATKRSVRGEVPFNGTNGRRIYDYIFVPVLGAHGEVEAVAGTTRDVTERKAMEEELRLADRRKDDFIALLAHELRNPLGPIRNGLEILQIVESREEQALARDVMDRQLSHMVRLIDDLLDVSRIGRNKMELRRARVKLADVMTSAAETARPLMVEAGHELILSLPAAPLFLDADLTRLAQVFGNLLTNSAKYTPARGHIWITAERHDAEVTVKVRDDGIGIPAESLPAIFDMFSQVDRSTERASGGLGIGLALVKGLVEMHGGTVGAESPGLGQGSTFTVTLPIVVALSEREPAPGPARPGAAGPRRRILVADDNKDAAHTLATMLRLWGNDVETANDGLSAVTIAERFRPEVMLIDVGMPKLNGHEVTRFIRARDWGQGVFVFALTGWGQASDRERSREAGCDGHLVKPVDLADLRRQLAEIPTRRSGS